MARGPRPPAWLIVSLGLAAAAAVWYPLNWVVQAARKPSEIVGLLEGGRFKTPRATWEAYGDLFREHATETITPAYLAALAQVESEGNPIARTYWRWRWTWHPFRLYAPASSAAGMFQITDGAFQACRRLCIHDGRVAKDGPWHDWRSCWFNAFYNRLLPSHAVEMTAACLDDGVSRVLAAAGAGKAGASPRQDLASIIHLCGQKAGASYARGGFRAPPGRCGAHDPQAYVRRVRRFRDVFARMASGPWPS